MVIRHRNRRTAQQRPMARLEVQMVDRDVIERVGVLWGVKVQAIKGRNGWKPTFRVQLAGSRALDLMGRLYPYLSARRQAQIDAVTARLEEGQ